MKVLLNPTTSRKALMPIIAATMLTTAATANTHRFSKDTTKQNPIEYFNKQTFDKADINKDHALSYSEFAFIPQKVQEPKGKSITPASPFTLKKQHYIGLFIFSLLLAGIDIIRNSTKTKK